MCVVVCLKVEAERRLRDEHFPGQIMTAGNGSHSIKAKSKWCSAMRIRQPSMRMIHRGDISTRTLSTDTEVVNSIDDRKSRIEHYYENLG